MRTASRQVKSVQQLRAVAALSIVVFHAGFDAGEGESFAPLAAGVDLFFVISGFVMWITTSERSISPVEFWRRRIERIVPLYWLMTTVAVIAAVVLPSMGGPTSVRHVVGSYLFVPVLSPDTGRIEPIVSPGWTLNLEMYFYLVFGFVLLLAVRYRIAALTAVLGGVVALGTVLSGRLIDFYSAPIIFEFLFGVFVGKLYLDGVRLPRLVPAIVWPASVAFFLFTYWSASFSSIIEVSIPAALIVGTGVLAERAHGWPTFRLGEALGDASYSIYICHGFALTGFSKVLSTGGAPAWALIFLGPPVATIGGLLVYRFVETPITNYFKSRRRSAPTPQPVAA